MLTWSEAWDRWLDAVSERAIDHTQRGCCEAHILYGKPGTEAPTGVMNGVSGKSTPRPNTSRKGRRNP